MSHNGRERSFSTKVRSLINCAHAPMCPLAVSTLRASPVLATRTRLDVIVGTRLDTVPFVSSGSSRSVLTVGDDCAV